MSSLNWDPCTPSPQHDLLSSRLSLRVSPSSRFLSLGMLSCVKEELWSLRLSVQPLEAPGHFPSFVFQEQHTLALLHISSLMHCARPAPLPHLATSSPPHSQSQLSGSSLAGCRHDPCSSALGLLAEDEFVIDTVFLASNDAGHRLHERLHVCCTHECQEQ